MSNQKGQRVIGRERLHMSASVINFMHPAEDETKNKKREKTTIEEKNRKLKNFAVHTLTLCNKRKKKQKTFQLN